MKTVVFDLGGTLMQYVGMPYSWVDFYYKGFESIIQKYNINISQEIIGNSVQMLKDLANILHTLKERGYAIAALTDLPSAMPDEIFKRDISELLGYFDYYVSTSVSGYRKPNCRGLQMIAEKFTIPITELIFIGDEEKDRKTACNANCKFIRVQHARKETDSISNLYELLGLL